MYRSPRASGRRSFRWLHGPIGALAWLAFGCGAEATLELTFIDPAQCAAFCVQSVSFRIDGGPAQTIACGEPASVSVDPDTPVELSVNATGDGFALRGQTVFTARPGRAIDISVPLVADGRPQILSIEPARDTLLGDTPVTITGDGFGQRSSNEDQRYGVSIDGRPVEIASWSDDEIVVLTSEAGPVEVSRCSVTSTTAVFSAPTVAYSTVQTTLTGCTDPRLVAGDAAEPAEGFDRLIAAFSCGGSRCDGAAVAQLAGTTGQVLQSFEPFDDCPYDVAVIPPGRGVVALEDETVVFENTGLSELAVLDRRGLQFSRVTVVVNNFVWLVGRDGAPWIWPAIGQAPVPAFTAELQTVSALDGPHFIGTAADDDFVYGRLAGETIDVQRPIGCGRPKVLARPRAGPLGSDRIVVACDDVVEVFESNGSPRRIDLPSGVGPLAAGATTRDGRVALLYTDTGVLIFVGLDTDDAWTATRAVMPAAEMPATRRALVRAPRSDHFYLTGAEFGEIVHADLTARADP